MKICKECQAGNSDGSVICRDCGASLRSVMPMEEEAILKAEMKAYEDRQRRNRRLVYAGLTLMGVLNILFFIIAIIRGSVTATLIMLLFSPAAGYVSLFHADKLFKLDHMFDIENLQDVRPSEWYYFKQTIGGIWVTVAGTVSIGILALS